MRFFADDLDFLDDWYNFAERLVGKPGIVMISALLVLAAARPREQATRFLAAIATTSLVNSTLKVVFGRQRPPWDRREDFAPELPADQMMQWFGHPTERLRHLFEQDWLGFPSGHSAAAGVMAAALSRFYPRAWPVFWGFALLAGSHRLHNARHYASDCLAGFAVGIVVWRLLAPGSRLGDALVARVSRLRNPLSRTAE